MTDDIARAHIRWASAYRVIRSIHPPIDLFEDIAEPQDWELIASAESKTNPRIWAHIGRLDLVPPERRVSGPGASWLMAPFVHVSTDRPGRFTDGTYGVYSAGRREETAIREVAYHHGRAMAASAEEPGWTSQFRSLVNSVDAVLHDVRPIADCHDPDDYTRPQALARRLRDAGSDGVVFRSVRDPGGECVGLFWPDLASIPVQGAHYDFHWDGTRVDMIRESATSRVFALPS